jgi:predicted porin
MQQRWLLWAAPVFFSLAWSTGASAEDIHPGLSDPHTFYAGAFFQESDGEIASALKGVGSAGIDTDDLGVDDRYTSWMLGYNWRFAERWTLTFRAHVFDTDGDTTVRREFEYEGERFEAGATLESDFSVGTYLVDVMYSVYKSDRAELQLGGGLHAFDFDVEMKGTVFVDDNSRSRTVVGDDLLAPLPNLRLNGAYALSPRWMLRGDLGWLSANVDDWDGSYSYIRLSTDYRFAKRFGVGLGYQYFDIDVSHERTRTKSTFDLTYQGPMLYLSYSF